MTASASSMTSTASSTDVARYRALFWVAAIYDLALGFVFFFFGEQLLEALEVTLPPHISYIHLPAVFVAVQGIGYAIVALAPMTNLGIVKVGIIYKAGYAALAAYYLLTDQIPAMFFAWFGLFDFLFFLAFVWFLRRAWRAGAH